MDLEQNTERKREVSIFVMSDYVIFRRNPLPGFFLIYQNLTSSIINHLKIHVVKLITTMSFFFTVGVKSFAANHDFVTKWCLNRADQAKNVNALKEMSRTYISSG